MHSTVFAYLKPTDAQLAIMDQLRAEFATFAGMLEETLPDGLDKTYIMRRLRTTAMWCNVCVTRHNDGSPRS